MKFETTPICTSTENERILRSIETRQHTLKDLSKYLSELESQLALIFAASPDIIVFLDTDFKIIKISDAAFTILGYKREELVNKPLWNFIDERDVQETQTRFKELKQKKVVYFEGHESLVNHWISKDGHRIKLVWRFSLCDERENQTIGVATDITEFNTTNLHSYKLLLKTVESSTDGIVITDAQRTNNSIVYVNKAYEKMTGYTNAELLGQNCRILQTEEAKKSRALSTLKNCISTGKNCDVLLQNKRKNGEIYYARIAVSAVVEQNIVVNYIGVVRDITDKIDIKYEWSPNAESGFIHLTNQSRLIHDYE
jgi:PAS domain S-box-containing protein